MKPGWSRWMLIAVSLALASPPSFAQSQLSIDERLQRLERLLGSDALLKMLDSLEGLKAEVRDLRGEIELQTHDVNQLKQRQRELYLDVDRRLQEIETRGPAPQIATTEAPPAGASADPSVTGQSGDRLAAGSGSTGGSTPAAIDSTDIGIPTTGAADAEQLGADDAPAIDPVREQQDYQAAFNLLKGGRYDDAAKAFREFLGNYPGGQFADNAQYWLGETFYVTRQFESAMSEFQSLILSHPSSQKLTHAMLKVGYIHQELGDPTQARQVLTQLTEQYPQSTAAGLARKRLQRLSTE